MPQNPAIVATKSQNGKVYVYKTSGKKPRPVFTLNGHSREGYGLEWSRTNPGYLASGSDDGLVCVWDTAVSPSLRDTLKPIASFSDSNCVIEVYPFQNLLHRTSRGQEATKPHWQQRATMGTCCYSTLVRNRQWPCTSYHFFSSEG